MASRLQILLVLLALLPGMALAQTAGRFLAAVGNVRVVGMDGAERAASRGGVLSGGETVTTGTGLAQIRLVDGSLVSVRSNTEFFLQDFRYEEEDPGVGRMFVSLLRGSLRALTGLIGSTNPSAYRITTPHATIGIRGTDHETTVTLQAVDGFQAGTFDVVYSGGTRMTTRAGFVDVGPSQAAFTASAAAPPRVIPVPRFLRNRPPMPAIPAADLQGNRAATPGEAAGGRAPQGGGAPALAPGASRAAGAEQDDKSAVARPLLINPLVSPIRPRTPPTTEGGKTGLAVPGAASRSLNPSLSPTRTLDSTKTLDSSTTLRTLAPSTTTLDSSTTLRTLDPSIKTLDSSTTLRTLDPSTTTLDSSTTLRRLAPSTTTLDSGTTLRTLDPSTTTLDSSTTLRTLAPAITTMQPTLEPSTTTTLSPTTTLDSSSTLRTLDTTTSTTTTTIKRLEPTTTETLRSPTLTQPLNLR